MKIPNFMNFASFSASQIIIVAINLAEKIFRLCFWSRIDTLLWARDKLLLLRAHLLPNAIPVVLSNKVSSLPWF